MLYDDEYEDGYEDCGCACCHRRMRAADVMGEIRPKSADHDQTELRESWYRDHDSRTLAEWHEDWRQAGLRPELEGPVITLYRGGVSPHSMSWTNEVTVAMAFANHQYFTTLEYQEVLGDYRLPVWVRTFPVEAILAHLTAEAEFLVDIERFPQPTPGATSRHLRRSWLIAID